LSKSPGKWVRLRPPLCRAFLKVWDDQTVRPTFSTPRLGPKQLIRSINDEFGINKTADDTKDLIDKLNAS